MVKTLLVRFLSLFLLILASEAVASAAENAEWTLPPGETFLSDIAAQRIGWQSYGKKQPVLMPEGWGNADDPASGIMQRDEEAFMQRRAVLIHSPWRVAPGKTWIDYPVCLPAAGPVGLSFGITMSEAAMEPGKSDGVTFSCFVLADGQERQLMREHYVKAAWKDFHFDLSPYAGKKIAVRFQVEPGPKNNASFDFSYFGDAKITVGSGDNGNVRKETLARLTNTRAYHAVEKATLLGVANRGDVGVASGNILPCTNTCEPAGDGFRLSYAGDDCRIVYAYQPKTGTLSDFTVQVDDQPAFSPAAGSGLTAAFKRDGKSQYATFADGRLVGTTHDKTSFATTWEYNVAGQKATVQWTYKLIGKALCFTVQCDAPIVQRFSLGHVAGVPLVRKIPMPYLSLGCVHYLPGEGIFAYRCCDWTKTHASTFGSNETNYDAKTDGTRNPLFEGGFIAVSPNLDEVLPNLPSPPSPFKNVLGPRIMLDIWGHHKGTYQGDAENLKALKDNGVDWAVIIQHAWQHFGYDVKLPDHLPANDAFGGDAGMVEFGRAANACGYVWSLHENYIDLYPDAPSYDPSARVLMANGEPSKAWYNSGTKVQSFGLKCNRALAFAKQNAPEAHRRYATTAAYLDVHPCVPPWHQLDHEAGQPMAAMCQAKMKYDTELFQFMRDTHGGPMFGEGANHFYWAGRCDGVEAQVQGGENHRPLLDFDLLKIHPQMVNHGMGYYERWFAAGQETRLGVNAGTVEQFDKYRAQELAYGHAGFIGGAEIDNVFFVAKEHHMVHPVQKLYGEAKPAAIRYEIDGRWVDAGAAAVVGDTSRQKIVYDSGLTLWVNWRPEPWTIEGHTLPQWGYLAKGPGTTVVMSTRDGRWSDYAECPEYVFADARTWFPMPHVRPSKKITPSLHSFEYLGDNRVRVTYAWKVGEPLDADYVCFAHGLTGPKRRPKIAFQQDHKAKRPTSQWRAGETVLDGPYTFTVPAKTAEYEFVTGLYKSKSPRLVIRNESGPADTVALARLKVTAKDGKVTRVVADKAASGDQQRGLEPDAFFARLNPAGTIVDFGSVATDGAVKINREAKRLVVFPYPRDNAFHVTLDLKALAPEGATLQPSAVKVHALAAGDCHDLGVVESRLDGSRLSFTVGKPDASRYVISLTDEK